MNAPPGSGDYFGFEDIFGGEWVPPPADHSLPFAVLDRLLVTEDVYNKCVILVMRDSQRMQQPGVGVTLTVAQASQVLLLIQKSITNVESAGLGISPDTDIPPMDSR